MIEIGSKVAEYAAIFLVGLLLCAQIQGLSLEAKVSQAYTTFYFQLVIMGLVSVTAMVAFHMWYFSHDVFRIAWQYKAAILGAWTIFIVLMSSSGNQIWPVPKASMETFQLSTATEFYTSSVIPGFAEDLFYLCSLPMLFAFLWFVFRENAMGAEIGATEFIAAGLIASIIASTGYNIWVIPGFTSSHVPAYGSAQSAYAGAWIFSAGQSVVYFVTNTFFPAAHVLHNLIIVYGQLNAVVT